MGYLQTLCSFIVQLAAKKLYARERITPGHITLSSLLTAALESRTFCLLTVAGIAALYTDLSCMTFTLVIVHTIRSFAVDLACRRGLSRYIAVRIPFSFLETVTASLLRALCRIAAYHDPVKVTVEILVVGACLYRTS